MINNRLYLLYNSKQESSIIMKNYLVLAIVTLFVFAGTASSELYRCSAEYDLSPVASRYVTRTLGVDFLSKQVVKGILRKNINKTVSGHYDIELDSYGALDLVGGRFKGIEISGENLLINNVAVTRFDARTICNFNYINYKENPVEFLTQIPMTVDILLTDNDINKTFFNKEYKRQIEKINEIFKNFFEIKDIYTEIKNNKLYFYLKAESPMLNLPIKLTISSNVSVENGGLELTDMVADGVGGLVPEKLVRRLMNLINPLVYTIDSLEGSNSDIIVKKIKIIDNKIQINGIILLGDKK